MNKKIKTIILFFIISCLMLFPNIIINKGRLVINGDFFGQQIPFNEIVNNEIKKGNTLYTFKNDLGSSIIEGYGFYGLFSPFFILALFFKSYMYQYLIGIFLIIKFFLTCLFSYLCFKRFTENNNLALIGSLMYSFSGYQIFNILYNSFHDVTLLFPLIIISIDDIFINNKKGRFCLILALIIFTNYVFAFAEILLVIIYLFSNIITKRYKINKKMIISFIIELIIGIGLSMVLLFPSFISVINNPRININISFKEYFIYPFTQYIDIFKSFLLPCDLIDKSTFTGVRNWNSCEMWLPLFGIILVIPYLLKHKKDYLCIIIYIIIIFMFIPVLNSSFTIFNSDYYARWFFIPTFFFSLVSIKTLEEKIDLTKGIKLFIIINLIYLLLCVIFYNYISKYKIINVYFKESIIIYLINLVLCYIGLKKFYKNNNIKYIFYLIILSIYMQGYHYMIYVSKNKPNDIYNNINFKKIVNDNEFYRVKYDNCIYNLHLYQNTNSIETFNSTISPSSFKFYKLFNINRKQLTQINTYENEKYLDLLSTKYIFSCNKEVNYNNKYKILKKDKNYILYYNKNYLKQGIIINDINNKILNILPTANEKANYVIKNSIRSNIKTVEINNGLKSEVDLKENGYILYTIPYDNDFDIYVNNKKIKYYNKINFILFKLEKGKNKILIKYSGRKIYTGLFFSLISIIIYFIYLIKNRGNL